MRTAISRDQRHATITRRRITGKGHEMGAAAFFGRLLANRQGSVLGDGCVTNAGCFVEKCACHVRISFVDDFTIGDIS